MSATVALSNEVSTEGWLGVVSRNGLTYCSAFGDTPEEAVQQILIAKEAWLQAARGVGQSIPQPSYQPISTR
jgi:predicted RNase H-like HicB family nuclease